MDLGAERRKNEKAEKGREGKRKGERGKASWPRE